MARPVKLNPLAKWLIVFYLFVVSVAYWIVVWPLLEYYQEGLWLGLFILWFFVIVLAFIVAGMLERLLNWLGRLILPRRPRI
jgi:branched-subunit amino acid permease